MSEIIRKGGKEYEVVEWACTDPPGSWNDNVGSWTMYAKPVEQPSEREQALRRVKELIEMYKQLGQKYPPIKLDELIPDLELLIKEEEG